MGWHVEGKRHTVIFLSSPYILQCGAIAQTQAICSLAASALSFLLFKIDFQD
jgi:hypothetical protein